MTYGLAPSVDDFYRLAREAWDAMPSQFRVMAGNVLIRVEDLADEEMLDDEEDPLYLTGVYQGDDLTQRSITDPSPQQPIVILYRLAILNEWAERGDVMLAELISHVLVHEIGHHFGLSDEAMDAILERDD